MNADAKLKGEALWVLCNVIISASTNDLVEAILKYRANERINLIAPLSYNLIKLAKGETKLLFEMLNSIEILLKLDKRYPHHFNGRNSMLASLEIMQGIEALESLQHHSN